MSMDDSFLYIWFKSEKGDVIGQNQCGDRLVGVLRLAHHKSMLRFKVRRE